MRILTILMGLIMTGAGVFLIANEGITFLSVAFVVGLFFVVSGLIECLSYTGYRGEDEDKTWILIDGTTTFVLGCLILMDRLSSDAVVPYVLGLWVLVTGIRNFVRAWERFDIKDFICNEHLVIGLLNVVSGVYVFFDKEIFNMAAITIIGICMLVQGLNLVLVGTTIIIRKPELAKTKDEKLEELKANADKAHKMAKQAIKAAKAAKAELREVQAMPEEKFDRTIAPRPTVGSMASHGLEDDEQTEGTLDKSKTIEMERITL